MASTLKQYSEKRKTLEYLKGFEYGQKFAVRNSEIIRNVLKDFFKKSEVVTIQFDSKYTKLMVCVPELDLNYSFDTPSTLQNSSVQFTTGYWDAYISGLSELLNIPLSTGRNCVKVYRT